MIAEVIVDITSSEVDKVFDYIVPENLNIKVGTRVSVPFGKRYIEGFVVKLKESSKVSKERLKPISRALDDFQAINDEMLLLKDYMREKYHLRLADTLRLFIPAEMRTGRVKVKTKKQFRLNDDINLEELFNSTRKSATAQRELLGQLKKGETYFLSDYEKYSAYIKKLSDMGVLKIEDTEVYRAPKSLVVQPPKFKHTKEQERAIEAVKLDKKQTYLIFGVTGSGKTEVYMSLIERVLKEGKTAIMLVPEISLTPQIFSNFKSRFGDNVAILHSGLSSGERYDEWRRIHEGEARVVVGARSAIFAPVENLGIIIIDEEHDGSYSSETNPRYKTHDIALFRSKFNSCPLILGSATPSIESFYHAEKGEYKLLELPARVNNREMPKIQIVDMLNEIREGNTGIFSRALKYELEKCISEKRQAILFLNRRGFTSFFMCKECGYVAKCTDCDVTLVYHKAEDRLKCHYCGKRYKALTVCPNCKSSYIKQGAIGTQKVVEELEELFPNVKIYRMDNDTTQSKDAHQRILATFGNTKPSILVGTQMIAKGHDFPDVTLVGIIDADHSLYQSDYRSTERAFALLTQVSGRAGRSEAEGKVILQSYSPRHYVYKFASNYNYKAFYNKEINLREVTHFPPFSTILRVLVTSEKEEVAKDTVKGIYSKVCDVFSSHRSDFFYLDAMKSPISRIKNKTRFQILMRFTKLKEDDIIKKIYKICDEFKSSKASIFVEIDPQNLS